MARSERKLRPLGETTRLTEGLCTRSESKVSRPCANFCDTRGKFPRRHLCGLALHSEAHHLLFGSTNDGSFNQAVQEERLGVDAVCSTESIPGGARARAGESLQKHKKILLLGNCECYWQA
jgi:hypothetical protein